MERFSFIFLVAGLLFFAFAFVVSAWIPMLPVQDLEVRTVDLAGAPFDCPLDIVLGHALTARLVDREPESRIGIRVATASSRGNRDFPDQFGEQLATLLVLRAFAMLDVRPLAVTRHGALSRMCRPVSADRSRAGKTSTSRGRAVCPVAATTTTG